MYVLVVNAGSSSLKYQVFNMENEEVIAKGVVEKIGVMKTDESGAKVPADGITSYKRLSDGTENRQEMVIANHSVATELMLGNLLSAEHGIIKSLDEIYAVGHRVVNGGKWLTKPTLVNESVIADLRKCLDIAPVHTKAHLMGLEGCIEHMPKTPQVLVIDTAFHSTMPKKAYTYPIKKETRERLSIRRYGFHGSSHRYVSAKAIEYLGGNAEGTKVITCHLGNGSSIGAVKDGKIIDTSMGFTPLEGVIMGSRCGSIDPAIVPFVMENEGIAAKDMGDWMNKECGFLGMCGSSDLRDVERMIGEGNEEAKLALDILGYQVKKYVGSYAAAMNGVDAVVFTAGIGENNPTIRQLAMEGMEFFGIKIDPEKNKNARSLAEPIDISADDSKVRIYVIFTNEELVIARDTKEVVDNL